MKSSDSTYTLDGIDKTILSYLMKDARTPILEISRKVGISGAAIHQRLRKLEQAGVLEGSKMMINTKKLGYRTMAYIGVYLDKAMNNPVDPYLRITLHHDRPTGQRGWEHGNQHHRIESRINNGATSGQGISG